MNQHYRDRRKIDPTRGTALDDGSPNEGDRIEIGPTALARREWREAGLPEPDLAAMRAFRLDRLLGAIAARGVAGALLFDPLNIRYATDSTNMQLWNAHNPFRACLVLADGHVVLWDYSRAPFLAGFNPLVREVRSGAGFFYFGAGDRTADLAAEFVAQVADLIAAHAPGERRLAVDKIMLHGARALEARGLDLTEGEELTEHARAIKGPDEIRAMRCSIHACEMAMAAMEGFARDAIPRGGVTEDDVWAVLHAENVRRGGEWIETRLLSSGPRTNPWFQECGPRVISEGEVLAFDTDLIGPYGLCCDISRTWWIGDMPARPDMIAAMRHGIEHIEANISLLRPGVNVEWLSRNAHVLAPEYQEQKYSCLMHGVGLCDEWPLVAYPDQMVPGAFDHPLEAGTCLCVEALISPEGGDFSIKLEDQGVLTEGGFENMTTYELDPRLTG
ncbi:MAG: dimethylsulfonioproprionate lyase DddP [Hasllibacter sp.]